MGAPAQELEKAQEPQAAQVLWAQAQEPQAALAIVKASQTSELPPDGAATLLARGAAKLFAAHGTSSCKPCN